MKIKIFPILLITLLIPLDSSKEAHSRTRPAHAVEQVLETPDKGNQAVVESSQELREFKATYRIAINNVPTLLKARLSIKREEGDKYHMEFKAGNLFLNATESSSFEGTGCRKRPTKHQFTASGFGMKKSRAIDFDWQNLRAKFKVKKRTGDFQITDQTYDELNMYLGIRCAMKKGAKKLALHLAREDQMTIFYYKLIGEEEIKVPYGKIKALKLKRIRNDNKRTTYLWLAPELDYLMVKMHHIENATLQGELLLAKMDFTDNS